MVIRTYSNYFLNILW